MRAKPFFIGLSAGVIGGLTSILFTAPQSGKQLRSNIAHTSKQAKLNLEEVKHHSASVKDSVMTLKNEAKNNIPKIIDELKGSISAYKDEIGPKTDKLKEEIDSLKNSINEIEQNLSNLNKDKNKPKEIE